MLGESVWRAIGRRVVGPALRIERLHFGPFRLDPAQRLLFRAESSVALRPKTLEVLLLLLRRAGEVVSKEEILATVWEGNAVTEYVLTTCISELRAALGEEPKRPRFLKTVHRTGYQFVAEVAALKIRPPIDVVVAAPAIVGRDRELAQLEAALHRALAGQRQIIFVTGEMGIGKTTLADEFIRLCVREGQAWQNLAADDLTLNLIARGQCIEQFGASEPYMPVLEAIGRLGRELDTPVVVDVLRRHAPTWLAQIPGLLTTEQRAELRGEVPTQTQEHMLRLIADGIEALGERHLLVLLLEDLHLSDHATLELIAALALRCGPARLLILGTFRNAESFAAASPFQDLKQQLLLHRQCEELALAPLTRDAVETYLSKRFVGLTLPSGLGATLHNRTEGNPLFIGRLVDQLLDDGVLSIDGLAGEVQLSAADIGSHVPRNLRALVEQRTDSLAALEREVVETASVVGVQFWSSSVAAALDRNREEIERLCRDLSRHHGFLVVGESDTTLPDLGARYTFSHALYQQVLYERIDATRRQRLHRVIGAALRETWAERAPEIAAALASHFERGGDLTSAIEFYDKAAVAAAAHAANREAVGYLDRGLTLLDRLEDSPARRERQLDLLMTRGPAVLAASGYGSVEVLNNYRRSLGLARQVNDSMRQMSSLLALAICEQTRGNLVVGEQLDLELERVAEAAGLPPPFIAQLRNPLSQVRLYQGAVEESLALSDAAVAAMEMFPLPLAAADSRPAFWGEPRVMLHCQRAAASFALGRLAQAGAAIEQALSIAQELRHPFNLTYAFCYASLYEDTMGRWQPAIRLAQQALEIARTHEFPFWEGVAKMFLGHATACADNPEPGVTLLRDGFDLWRGTGSRLNMTMYLNMLADAYLRVGDVTAAQIALAEAEAYAEQTGEKVFLPETLRFKAECQHRSGSVPDEVAATLHRAITLARQQGTKLWELRSLLALHRLRQSPGSRRELAAVCAAFDNEPLAYDVMEARLLLA